MLEVTDPELAERMAHFVDEVRALYPRFIPTRSSTAASS
jgi:hypothetical protein